MTHDDRERRQVRERPIIFSEAMVRALLDGRKTQTRRIVKPQPEYRDVAGAFESLTFKRARQADGFWLWPNAADRVLAECPYGVPGDRLWVREKHCFLDVAKSALSRFPLGPENGNACGPDVWNLEIEYSDGTQHDTSVEGKKPKLTRQRGDEGWRSPIHMPRSASRITLELTDVRVQQVTDITEEDALAEGCAPGDEIHNELFDPNTGRMTCAWVEQAPNATESFCNLWQRIHRVPHDEETAWERNDWVWALTFKRVTP